RSAAATSVASASSCSVAPAVFAFLAWISMQYGHWVVRATATAINSLYLSGITPPANAAPSNATNARNASGASSPSCLNLARFFMSYMSVSSVEGSRSHARTVTRRRLAQVPHGLLGRPDGVGQESEVDHRRPVAVALLVGRAGRRVPDHRHLEP